MDREWAEMDDGGEVGGAGHLPSLPELLRRTSGVLRRRWKIIAAIWAGVVAATVAYLACAIPQYTSSGAIQVSAGSGAAALNPLLELAGGGAQAEVQTEVEIIKRREFLLNTLRHLRLQILDAEEPQGLTTNFEVSLWGESPTRDAIRRVREQAEIAEIPAGIFAPVRVELSMPEQGLLLAKIGEEAPRSAQFAVDELLDDPNVRLKFKGAPLEVGESVLLEVLPDGALLERYAGQIDVSGLGSVRESTNLIQISATHPDRETARAIVQTMMDGYLEKTLEWQSKSAAQAAQFIEGQLEEVRKTLLQSEDKLLAFARAENAIQLDTQARVAIEKMAELEAQRIGVELQERSIGNVLARIKGGRTSKANLTANFFEDPVLVTNIAALTEAESKFETLRASMTPDHPAVQQLRRTLEFQQNEVARLMKSAQRNLEVQKQSITREIDAATASMSDYPDKQVELGRLTRDTEVSQRLYTLLLEKLEEAEIMKASTTTDKRIVDSAALPHKRVSPNRSKLAGTGLLGGLMLGIGFAFAAHRLQRRLDTVESVRELAKFPAYGVVPAVPHASAKEQERFTVDNVWNSYEAVAEAFRALGVGITLLPRETGRGKLLMLTSSQPGEGKSTIAANLAEALGRSGKRVLVVDLDLRKPVQHRLWGLRRNPGYTDLLAHGANAASLGTFATTLERHDTTILTAGSRVADTVAAILSPSLESLLSTWINEYDFVILDAAPAFVAETIAVAHHADLVLVVARPGVVERGNLSQAIEALSRVNVPKGLVLNAVSNKHTDYYYGSSYYYYGTSYGEDDVKKASGA